MEWKKYYCQLPLSTLSVVSIDKVEFLDPKLSNFELGSLNAHKIGVFSLNKDFKAIPGI
jgi:hypothetical protein